MRDRVFLGTTVRMLWTVAFLSCWPELASAQGSLDVTLPGPLPPGKSVTVRFAVTVANPVAAGITAVSVQGVVSGSGIVDQISLDLNI